MVSVSVYHCTLQTNVNVTDGRTDGQSGMCNSAPSGRATKQMHRLTDMGNVSMEMNEYA